MLESAEPNYKQETWICPVELTESDLCLEITAVSVRFHPSVSIVSFRYSVGHYCNKDVAEVHSWL